VDVWSASIELGLNFFLWRIVVFSRSSGYGCDLGCYVFIFLADETFIHYSLFILYRGKTIATGPLTAVRTLSHFTLACFQIHVIDKTQKGLDRNKVSWELPFFCCASQPELEPAARGVVPKTMGAQCTRRVLPI
jgi:hypothetical protein